LSPGITLAHPGIGIVSDSKGNIYYTDLVHVWKIAVNGDHSIAVRDVHTHELYIDQDDNLYGEHEWYNGEAANTWGNYVWRFSPEGVFEKTIADVEGFLDNNTLVRDLQNNSYWVEQTGDHEFLKKESPEGDSCYLTTHQFDDIRWMHFSQHDDNLYVVDLLTIKKVSPDGEISVIRDDLKSGSGSADRHHIFGMWTDKEKNLYVAVHGAGHVLKIHPEGEKTIIFKSGTFWSPVGGTITDDGTLWIMEFSVRNRTRVRKVNPDGKDTIYKN